MLVKALIHGNLVHISWRIWFQPWFFLSLHRHLQESSQSGFLIFRQTNVGLRTPIPNQVSWCFLEVVYSQTRKSKMLFSNEAPRCLSQTRDHTQHWGCLASARHPWNIEHLTARVAGQNNLGKSSINGWFKWDNIGKSKTSGRFIAGKV